MELVGLNQEQDDEGSEAWWARHVHTPGPSWLSEIWRAGAVPFCPRFVPSALGVSHSSQVDI